MNSTVRTAWKAGAPLVVWLVLGLLPVPAGLEPRAWRYFALFAGVVAALILEPIPSAVAGLVGVVLATALGYVFSEPAESLRWGLSGFSDPTVWLTFGAFVFSLGYEKTGLGRRIALLLVKGLGGRTLGLGYAITLMDLILAPFTASNTGRSAGMIFPIVRNLPGLYGSEPGPTARRIGAYVMWTAFAATCITSSMFLTALAPNLLAVSMVKQATQVTVSWTRWFVGFLPGGLLLLALTPFLIYKLYPPEVKRSKEVPAWAAAELSRMGRFTARELWMAILAVLALSLWIFGTRFVSATQVVLIVIGLMVLTGVVRWEDILGHKQAWNVLVWFGTLVTLAGGLVKVGFVGWVAAGVVRLTGGLSPTGVMVVLVAFFFLVHYGFASLTAHTAAVLPVVLAAGAAIPGMRVETLALLLCYSLGLMGVITPYATGPAPVYYASGYVSRRAFWILGLAFGLIFLGTLLGIGIPYLARPTAP